MTLTRRRLEAPTYDTRVPPAVILLPVHGPSLLGHSEAMTPPSS